jgi:hypothetical protein
MHADDNYVNFRSGSINIGNAKLNKAKNCYNRSYKKQELISVIKYSFTFFKNN